MDEDTRFKTICIWSDDAGIDRVTSAGDPLTDDMPVEVRRFLMRTSYTDAYREACNSTLPVRRQDG